MMGPADCMDSDFMGDIDCAFFENILVDLPAENELGLGPVDYTNFPSIWPNIVEPLPVPDPILSCNNNSSNITCDLSTELSVPYEDITRLDWVANFVEESFSSGGMTLDKENSCVTKESSHNHFQTSSPVSVLESSSSSSSNSCSRGKTLPPSATQRARSKRPRPATFSPRPAIHLNSPTTSVTEAPEQSLAPVVSSEYENFAESHPLKKIPKPPTAEHKKKRKIKFTFPLGPIEMNQIQPSQAVRKCMHCEITKTPQWRAGPMGPKTLCNACGVRYKSGRLFPEYRPAASPTFVPALHSNSHKKVLEMRGKVGEETSMAGTVTTPPTTPQPELIPNTSNMLMDYM
ncbi:GATA transcription factor 8-like [Cornus florida]|uniref:GATA transcription factor 8-like n=1 Tax=Cornus florida TaxID=4283 RepID=UPI0028984087|nr:GATA transcription factor 8-like [Cornus florida]